MSDRPWHKRYHGDALTGFMVLTLEERGAFQTVLDMIYDTGGPIPDNENILARYMGVSTRKWRSLRHALIDVHGKISVDENGRLTNERAISEIENAAKTSRKNSENASKTNRKNDEPEKNGNENSDGPENSLPYARAFPETRDQIIEPSVLANSRSLDLQGGSGEAVPAKPKIGTALVDEAFAQWNKAASERGWPKLRALTDQRRKKLAARLKVHGADGWREALVNAYRSPILSCSPPTSWFTFDWIVKNDENLLKVLEGNYNRSPSSGFDKRQPSQEYTPTTTHSPEAIAAAQQRLRERGELPA